MSWSQCHENMVGAMRFFLAHLNGMRAAQWDWSPSPACRPIRQILLHMSETFPDRAALVEELGRPVPDTARAQALFEAAARRDYARLRRKYDGVALDSPVPMPGGDVFLGSETVAAGTLLMRRAWEECYHTGQIAYIRLATDPEWELEREVYGWDGPS